jgi:hypothetical protein
MVYFTIKLGVSDNYLEVITTIKNITGYCLGRVPSLKAQIK